MAKVLVQYLREYDRTPFGCMVALAPDMIGVSICNPRDSFNKKRARQIAEGRAEIVNNPLASVPCKREIYGYYGVDDDRTWCSPPIPMNKYVELCLERFKVRAERYFGKDDLQ